MSKPRPLPPPAADRRSQARASASEEIRLVAPSGQVFQATVVDRSLRGLRVQLGDASTLPTELTVLSRDSGAVHVARTVWRTPPYAGLSISRTIDMRSATGADTGEFRRLWREHIGR